MSIEPSQRGAAIHPSGKGLGPLVWIALLLACGAIVFTSGRGLLQKVADRVAAGKLVRADPDLAIVGQDDAAGTVTFKSRRTGMSVTVRMADVRQGRVSFTSDPKRPSGVEITTDGPASTGSVIKLTDPTGRQWTTLSVGGAPRNLPSWLPNYPGSTSRLISDSANDRGHLGSFMVFTRDPASGVIGWYGSQLKSAGLEFETTTFYGRDGPGGAVEAKSRDGKRTVSVSVLSAVNGRSIVNVSFNERL